MAGPVVLLTGGTGGAKLARGMLEHAAGDLVVIANTGDDIEIYGTHVSPDPDLCAYRLADLIDDRGWGLADDTFEAMAQRRADGEEIWFNLGDRDLAICKHRAQLLAQGATLTQALADLTDQLGITEAKILPMSDSPVRTRVRARDREIGLQEFLIREQGAGPIQDISFSGIEHAAATDEVLEAIACARAIIIGPSNPIISIAPILAVGGVLEALAAARAAVVAVSPIVAGTVLKGPTAACMQWAGLSVDAAGIAEHYRSVIDGLACDEHYDLCPSLRTRTRMDTLDQAMSLAYEILRFAQGLSQ